LTTGSAGWAGGAGERAGKIGNRFAPKKRNGVISERSATSKSAYQ